MTTQSQTTLGKWVDEIEETLIAIFLGLMTLITFANVVARYVFNDNLLWALEATVFLFAWLVLIGVSYCAKKNLHLGVDVILNLVSAPSRRILAMLAITACLAFSLLMLKGSWDYWYPFVNKLAFLETDDVPIPDFLQFLSQWLNEGERYEKLPRFIPYFALPLGMLLLTFRFLQAAWQIATGQIDIIIASHEAEDMEETMSTKPHEED
ncbi:MAG: TRAP transporter small permease [Sneathiella sp.]|nr:TRAP transporter small permease [Sneathiella sp.]